MALFRKDRLEPTIHPRLALDGSRLASPEENGDRRLGLLAYCQSLVRGHPVAKAWQQPLAEGYGLEEVVDLIRPAFVHEPSMIQIVGLRGALSYLHRNREQLGLFPLAVCITLAEDDVRGEHMAFLDPPADLSAETAEAAIGLAASILGKIGDGIPATMPKDEMQRHWGQVLPGRQLCLEYIAWVAVASLRCELMELMRPVLAALPKPAAFEGPGWYVDPLYNNGDRYWDGSDWTDRCRRGEDSRPGDRLEEVRRALW